MRFKVFLSIALGALWTWIIGGVFAMIGVFQFFFPPDAQIFSWSILTTNIPWYFWIAIAFFVWSIGLAWSTAKRIYIEPSELLKLTEMRTKGIKLRSKIERLKTKKDVKRFVKKYHIWEQEMLELVGKLSPSSKESIAHIRNFPIIELKHDVNKTQSRHRGIIETKLALLESFLQDYRRGLTNK
ncbi:MAG: hypothetical protein GYA18_09465 [Chloroflexi bacterium]|nr:hypothetical protein [Chloroflexota bacterium]